MEQIVWRVKKHKQVRHDVGWWRPECWYCDWQGRYTEDFESEAQAWSRYKAIKPSKTFPLITLEKVTCWSYRGEEGEEVCPVDDKYLKEPYLESCRLFEQIRKANEEGEQR